jgi:hypothetical protein
MSKTKTLAELVKTLPKRTEPRKYAIASQLNPEQYLEYLEMVYTLARMPRHECPSLSAIGELIKRKFNVSIPLRTLNEHIAKEKQKDPVTKAG